MPKTLTERKRSVNFLLGIESEPARNGVYIGLFETNPTIGATSGNEPSGGNYLRGQPEWEVNEADGSALNSNSVTIAGLPAGIYRYWGLFTAQTGGELIAFDALPFAIEMLATEDFAVAAGNIRVTEF